jgi:hypothetical protein
MLVPSRTHRWQIMAVREYVNLLGNENYREHPVSLEPLRNWPNQKLNRA